MELHTLASPQVISAIPFFTIGVTTYMRPALLQKALESILAQSFTDYEIIIVDDASTDETAQVVAQYVGPNVIYLRQPSNQGVGAARNTILRHARSECIVLLDDDDRLMPDFLEQIYQVWPTLPPSVGFVIAAPIIWRQTADGEQEIGEINYGAPSLRVFKGDDYLEYPFGGGSGMTLRTSAIRSLDEWFSTDRYASEDGDLMLRLAASFDAAILPQAKLKVYTTLDGNMTKDPLWSAKAREKLADKYRHTLLRAYPKTLYRYYLGAARAYYIGKNRASGRRCLWKAMRLMPFSRNTWRSLIILEYHPFLPQKYRQKLFTHQRHGAYQG